MAALEEAAAAAGGGEGGAAKVGDHGSRGSRGAAREADKAARDAAEVAAKRDRCVISPELDRISHPFPRARVRGGWGRGGKGRGWVGVLHPCWQMPALALNVLSCGCAPVL